MTDVPKVTNTGWECVHCGWPWPLPGRPPETAECDNCGDDEFWQTTPDDEPKVTNGDAVEVVVVQELDRHRSGDGFHCSCGWEAAPGQTWTALIRGWQRHRAGRAIAALSAHVREHGPLVLGDGVVAVPSEPTDAMVEAALDEWLRSQASSDADAMGESLRAALAVREEEG